MRVRIYTLVLLLLMSVPAFAHRPYTLDQPAVTNILNDFWSIYGTAEGANGVSGCEDMIHASTCWYEWNTLKCSWTNYGPFQKVQRMYFDMVKISGVNAEGKQAKGYLWPGFHSEKWFNLHEHFDQLPRFVCSIYNDYIWSRDDKFLHKMLPQAEAVTDYMLETMNGKNGVLICPGDNNGLSNTGVPSTYMDCLREGHIAAWINAGFYTAINNMADLEAIAGNKTKSEYYKRLASDFPSAYDKALWNSETSRYAGWRDINNNLHDAGYTFINVEALARGLGDPDKARKIFGWLDGSDAQPTVKGGHIGSKDVYQLVVAPRANTSRIPNEDWDLWSMPDRNAQGDSYTYGYGAALEDGGTMLWINYYDVMARLKWLDADNAWKKFSAMLFRCANDPKFLTVGHDHKYSFNPKNSYGENYLEVGTDYPFPESGISAMSMLYGFMGVWPCKEGLRISPNLPANIAFAQCDDVTYKGIRRSIRVEKGNLISDDKLGKTVDNLEPGKRKINRTFHSDKPFNTLGIMLGTYRQPLAIVKVSLSKLQKGIWKEVFARNIKVTEDNTWNYFDIPRLQGKSDYRLTLSNSGTTKIAWYRNDKKTNAMRVIDEKTTTVARHDFTDKLSEQVISIPSPFNRVSINVPGNKSKVTLSLNRRMGDGWYEVAKQEFYSNSWLPLTISDQPKGDYKIILSDNQTNVISEVHIESGTYTVKVTPGGFSASVKPGESILFQQ